MYADFTSGDGRLLVTFPASWANIDHCMGQPLRTNLPFMPCLGYLHAMNFNYLQQGTHYYIQLHKEQNLLPFGEILGYPWVKII